MIEENGYEEKEELEIKLNSTHLEDQKDRLVKELGLNQTEAQIISDKVRHLVEVKIKETGKQWSESVKKSFTNVVTAILIEETKAIKSIIKDGLNDNPHSLYLKKGVIKK